MDNAQAAESCLEAMEEPENQGSKPEETWDFS